MTPIGLGFRVMRGGSVVVGVSAGDREPRVVLSTLLATAAEGLALREVLRFAIGRVGIEVAELDEKSLLGLAAKTLDMSSAEIDACLNALGVTVGRPWRKEQKFACLSAWVAVTGRGCVDSHGD